MGFGALFLGIMFLYDFQVGLRLSGEEAAYAMLDLFPDVIGWILIFVGLNRLAKHVESLAPLKKFSLLFIVLSLVTLIKDTLLYNTFYAENTQLFSGEVLDFCVHLLELAFLARLFSQTAVFCRKNGEDKLAVSHANVPRIAAAEGFLFVLARLLRLLPLPGGVLPYVNVISVLDFLFLVFLIWYGVIAMLRALLRLSEN